FKNEKDSENVVYRNKQENDPCGFQRKKVQHFFKCCTFLTDEKLPYSALPNVKAPFSNAKRGSFGKDLSKATADPAADRLTFPIDTALIYASPFLNAFSVWVSVESSFR
ncbi:MAG: hypothetical protein ACI39E_06960, partial [Acutalibacteraceae bacterium]